MATKTYDLAVKTGEYTNNKGETKGRYVNIGVVMKGNDGKPFILLDTHFNPAGVPSKDGRFIVSMFEPKKKDAYQEAADDLNQEVPF